MELLLLAALLLSLAAAGVALRRRITRVRLQTTVHHVVDAAVAHRAFNDNPQGLKNRPSGMFPVAAATGHGGQRNENVTSVKYGPHWRALRCNLTAESLHPSRIASLGPLQQEAAQALVADLSARVLLQDAGEAVEVRPHVRAAVYALAARQCFGDGLDCELLRAMELAVRELADAMGELNPVYDGTWLTQLLYWRQLRHMLGFLDRQTKLYIPLIDARRQIVRPPSLGEGDVRPYVDSLLDARVPAGTDGGRRELRNDELVVLVAEFVGATYGSAVACLEWILAHLVTQPDVQNKLRREVDDGGELSVKSLRAMPYLNAVVLEALRMYPPVPILLRSAHGKAAKAVAPTTTTVPADGLRVMFDLGAIGRDGKVWTDPNEFRPERFLPGGEAEDVGPTPGRKEVRMMPFGAAHRVCPGITMGMMHIKCFLAALVRDFEWAPSPSPDGGVDLTEHNGFFKVMKKPLSARITPRRT